MQFVAGLFELVFLILLALPVAYLLMLLGAAALYRRPATVPTTPHNFAILIPAHDEAITLPDTLKQIIALRAAPDAPAPLVVVVADNCQDATAELARQAGAVVYERTDSEKQGKGHALAWAITRLLHDYDVAAWDTLVVLDADTIPAPDFLPEAQAALDRGAVVVQGCYDVLNPRDSWRTLLLYSAFVIYNHIRPLGRVRLGLSDGLRGNGMVFRRTILEQIGWQAESLVEDIEFTTRLVLAGLSVTYAPQARIYGQAAASNRSATSQRLRWEGGRFIQARQDVPRLLRQAFRRADRVAFDRAADLLIPPLALLVMGLVGFGLLNSALLFWFGGELLRATLIGWLGLLVGMLLFVLGGMAVARVGLRAYVGLLYAPLYIFWKSGLYLTMLFGRMPQRWVRTSRTQIAFDSRPVGAGQEKRD